MVRLRTELKVGTLDFFFFLQSALVDYLALDLWRVFEKLKSIF
jgi:hypothetical protein